MGRSGLCSRSASDRSWQAAKDREHAISEKLITEIAVVEIGIGENTFHAVGVDEHGTIVLRQKWSRGQTGSPFANMPACLIDIEA